MENYNELYKLWREKCTDPALLAELKEIDGNEDEILDRFYTKLKFGTAGLRGVLGAGTNRMNIYTVNQATQGIADYLNQTFDSPAVAIAYDSRINSDLFAKEAACVFAANDVKVYLYPELVPTPMLSFAVRRLGCSSGVIITASHNPAKYNGYKCYDPQGYQMTDAAATEAYTFIEKVDVFEDVKTADFDECLASGAIEYIAEDIFEEFYSLVQSKVINKDACEKTDLKVIYTPLNGTGNKPVRKILSRLSLKNVSVVPIQENPDGNFPTCPYPNPEIRQVFECAIEMARRDGADLLLATDPDCDRMGIAVFDGTDFKLMSGNEVGVLFTNYVLSQYKEKGLMPKDPVVLKSFVTSDLVRAVANSYGVKTVNLLTGFKYIGEYITNLEKVGEESNFLLAMEESYGYLFGTHARDKDAVVASQLVCEMAAFYKNQGKTLLDVMGEIYSSFGSYLNRVESFEFDGAAGMEKMKRIMDSLRNSTPKTAGGLAVTEALDYMDTKQTGLPAANIVEFSLENGNGVVVRPSGTEPKIKIYVTAIGKNFDDANALLNSIIADASSWLEV